LSHGVLNPLRSPENPTFCLCAAPQNSPSAAHPAQSNNHPQLALSLAPPSYALFAFSTHKLPAGALDAAGYGRSIGSHAQLKVAGLNVASDFAGGVASELEFLGLAAILADLAENVAAFGFEEFESGDWVVVG